MEEVRRRNEMCDRMKRGTGQFVTQEREGSRLKKRERESTWSKGYSIPKREISRDEILSRKRINSQRRLMKKKNKEREKERERSSFFVFVLLRLFHTVFR